MTLDSGPIGAASRFLVGTGCLSGIARPPVALLAVRQAKFGHVMVCGVPELCRDAAGEGVPLQVEMSQVGEVLQVRRDTPGELVISEEELLQAVHAAQSCRDGAGELVPVQEELLSACGVCLGSPGIRVSILWVGGSVVWMFRSRLLSAVTQYFPGWFFG